MRVGSEEEAPYLFSFIFADRVQKKFSFRIEWFSHFPHDDHFNTDYTFSDAWLESLNGLFNAPFYFVDAPRCLLLRALNEKITVKDSVNNAEQHEQHSVPINSPNPLSFMLNVHHHNFDVFPLLWCNSYVKWYFCVFYAFAYLDICRELIANSLFSLLFLYLTHLWTINHSNHTNKYHTLFVDWLTKKICETMWKCCCMARALGSYVQSFRI